MGKTGFTTIDFVILVVYLILVLLAGLLFSKKRYGRQRVFKGDGSIPWYVTSVSIFATLLSPISFLTLVGNSYLWKLDFVVCSIRYDCCYSYCDALLFTYLC